MNLFHDEEDDAGEPVPGLPQALPEGEVLIWQGAPNALSLAVHAFHIRFVALYFALATLWRSAAIASEGGGAAEIGPAVATSGFAGVMAIGVLALLAWAMARSTLYTITSRRIVLRYGVAIRKYVNLPFSRIGSANMKSRAGGGGDIALTTGGAGRVAYLHLWPHARPFRFANPSPMLRSVKNVENVAAILVDAMKTHSPATVRVPRPAGGHPQTGAATPKVAANNAVAANNTMATA